MIKEYLLLKKENRPLESIKDNYPKYVLTLDYLLQQRNGIKHENIIKFILDNKSFMKNSEKIVKF